MSVYKRKDRKNVYQVAYREPGSKRIIKIDFTGPNAKQDAEIFEQEIKLQKKKNPSKLASNESTLTLEKIVFLYIAATKPYKSKSSIKNESCHAKAILEHIGDVSVDDVTVKHLQKVKQDHLEKGISVSTFQRRWNLLRAAMNWAVDEEFIEANPLAGYKIKKPQREPILPPSTQEIQALFQASPPHLKRIILLVFYTGARPGPSELFNLQWQSVDLQNGWLYMLSANKGGKIWREIPIHEKLHSCLSAWKEEDNRLNLNTDHVIHFRNRPVQSIKKSWAKAKENAGIKRQLRPYDLRHAFITSAIDAGADVQAVANMAGHSDMKTTLEHYRHIKSEVKKTSIDRLPNVDLVEQNGGTKGG